MANYIIIAIIALWAVFALRGYMKQRREGCGCGGNCAACPGCTDKTRKENQDGTI